jgi:hypothetical protein
MCPGDSHPETPTWRRGTHWLRLDDPDFFQTPMTAVLPVSPPCFSVTFFFPYASARGRRPGVLSGGVSRRVAAVISPDATKLGIYCGKFLSSGRLIILITFIIFYLSRS